jgi:hypothetical protein
MDVSHVYAAQAYCNAVLWSIEDSFLQHRAGLLDEASWQAEMALLRTWLRIPSLRVTWKLNRGFAGGAYRDFVDALLKDTVPLEPFDLHSRWKSMMAQELGTKSAA